MRCLIPSINFKVLGKAITTLSRIGDELYVEPCKDGIYFRTVNAGRSAFASINFTHSFFSYYDLNASSIHLTTSNVPASNVANEDELLKCKVAMKSVLAVFRTPSNNVETCQIQLESNGSQLRFQLRCRHSIRKTYYVPVIECETVQAVYNKDNVSNKFSAQSRLLSDVMQNFQKNHEEISLTVCGNRIFFRNYSEVAADSRRSAVRTEVKLESLEFDAYTVGLETTVTFSLLELRALLLFAEATSLPIVAHFDGPGKPMVFTIGSLPSFEAHFVLATMTQEQNEHNSQGSTSTASTSQQSRGRTHQTSRVEADASVDKGIVDVNTGDIEGIMEVEAAEENMDVTFVTQQVNATERPPTPPWLQAQRFYFPRCFRDSQCPPPSPKPVVVLCPDSDPEDAT